MLSAQGIRSFVGLLNRQGYLIGFTANDFGSFWCRSKRFYKEGRMTILLAGVVERK